jgi:antitoxin CptB
MADLAFFGTTQCEVLRMAIDEARLRRIRWRSRRGLLENDLVLSRFLDRYAGTLSDEDVENLDLLLDMTDEALWDLIAGRAEADPRLAALVARLRS